MPYSAADAASCYLVPPPLLTRRVPRHHHLVPLIANIVVTASLPWGAEGQRGDGDMAAIGMTSTSIAATAVTAAPTGCGKRDVGSLVVGSTSSFRVVPSPAVIVSSPPPPDANSTLLTTSSPPPTPPVRRLLELASVGTFGSGGGLINLPLITLGACDVFIITW